MGERYDYTHSGEDIVLKFTDEPTTRGKYGNHSAWFDGGSTAIPLEQAYQNKHNFPEYIRGNMADNLVNASADELKELLEFLAENSLLMCKCGRTFDKENAVSTGFAGVKCGVCASEDNYCPDTDDNEHNMSLVSGRNNARKPTVRRCDACGYESRTPPTG